jgi:hypothetical protein
MLSEVWSSLTVGLIAYFHFGRFWPPGGVSSYMLASKFLYVPEVYVYVCS